MRHLRGKINKKGPRKTPSTTFPSSSSSLRYCSFFSRREGESHSRPGNRSCHARAWCTIPPPRQKEKKEKILNMLLYRQPWDASSDHQETSITHTTSSSGSPQKNMEMIFLLLLQLFVGGTTMWKNKKASHRGNPLRAETIRLNTVLYVDAGFSARCVVNSWWWLTHTLAVRVKQVTTKRQISQVRIEYWNYFSLSNLVAIQLQVPTTWSFICFD